MLARRNGKSCHMLAKSCQVLAEKTFLEMTQVDDKICRLFLIIYIILHVCISG